MRYRGQSGSRHRPAGRLLPTAALAGLAFGGGVWTSSCGEPAAGYDAVYHLIDHIDDADAVGDHTRPLRIARLEIGFDQRDALMQHPPTAYRFHDVPAGPGARLSVAPALNRTAWDAGSDGAGFELLCTEPSGEWLQLFALEIGPQEAERPDWHQHELPLDRCSSPRTSFELRTTCGPGRNCAADWASWGDAKVVYPARFEPRIERLALLISIDTLRPDRLSLYGAERETSPRLERRLEPGEQLFDLTTDPGETVNLLGEGGSPPRAADLRRLIRRHAETARESFDALHSTAGDPGLSQEEIQRLKALGYLGGPER